MGKDEAGSTNRVNYRRHDTFTCTVGSHLQYPITALVLLPRQIAGTNLQTPRGWIAGLARACVYVHDLLKVITRSNPKTRTRIKPRSKVPRPHSIPMNHLKLYLRRLLGRQCELNPQPFEYLPAMTIKIIS